MPSKDSSQTAAALSNKFKTLTEFIQSRSNIPSNFVIPRVDKGSNKTHVCGHYGVESFSKAPPW